MIFVVPIALRYSSCVFFLVIAVVSNPDEESISIAMLPTPPVAPVTTIGPISGVCLFSFILNIASPAAKPAVPIAIAVLVSV